MKITLLTMGTLGDVRPFLALAFGLEERGHKVTLAGPENFLDYVTKTYERDYVPIGIDSQQVLESDEGRRWMASGDTKQFMNEMSKIVHVNRFAMERDAAAACADCDLIIAHPLQIYFGCILSEKLHKPIMLANTFPVSPATSAFPHFLATTKLLKPSVLNKLSYRLVYRIYEKSVRQDMNEWRAKLGLAPLRGTLHNKVEQQGVPILQAFSKELLPAPKDWSEHVKTTGQWKIPDQYVPEQDKAALEPELLSWLNAGDAPIYFGFGSLPVLEPQKMIDMVIEIARTLQMRAIIASGWSEMESENMEFPDTIKMISSANHELLFPRCRVIVHHGGAGTTHTALESGSPSIICSTYADQPFWGERIEQLGIGKHIPFTKLNQTVLLQALEQLATPNVQEKANKVSQRMKEEQGLIAALDFIEKQMAAAPVYRN